MKRLVLILISILLLIVDNSFVPFISIKGASPSFLFIFAISYSIINGKKEGVIIGVISGLLQDIFFFGGFGVNALVNMLCCVLAGTVGEGIWRKKKLIPVLTIFITTILKFLGVYIIFYFLKINVDLLKGVYAALYNSIIMFLTYRVVIAFSEWEDKKSSWRIK
ncbi:rod shape-determining protein MreD [Clostridium paraputrificum]|uniref:rod shape-determining protein MreD n=1 Tax=Clostridium TaxID=1485 RepID=UPI003D34061B